MKQAAKARFWAKGCCLLLAALLGAGTLVSCGEAYREMEDGDRSYLLTFEEFPAEGEPAVAPFRKDLPYKFQVVSDELGYSARYSIATEDGGQYSCEVAVLAFRDDVQVYFPNNPLKDQYTEKLIERDASEYGVDMLYLSAAEDHFFLKLAKGRTMLGVIYLGGTADVDAALDAALVKLDWLSEHEDDYCAEKISKQFNSAEPTAS